MNRLNVTPRTWEGTDDLAIATAGDLNLVASRLLDGYYGFLVRSDDRTLRSGAGYLRMVGAQREAESQADEVLERAEVEAYIERRADA